jgi:ABC-2 type transport system permease protein
MLALYFRLIGARVRSQLQYRLSFWLDTISFAILTWVEFVSTLILFSRFTTMAGWRISEVALLYSFSSIAFSMAEMAGRGFDRFEGQVQTGAFDGVLTRPLSSFFQVLTAEFQLKRLGRAFQGLAVLIYALLNNPIDWTLERVLIIPVTIASGSLIFTSLLIISAAISFWTIRTPELINIFTAGGQQMTSYPQSIFHDWIRSIFLFIVPVAFASYPAGLLLLGRSDPNGLPASAAWLAPLAAALFFGVARVIWQAGVRHYTSTGT